MGVWYGIWYGMGFSYHTIYHTTVPYQVLQYALNLTLGECFLRKANKCLFWISIVISPECSKIDEKKKIVKYNEELTYC